jgi:hypothetical protein
MYATKRLREIHEYIDESIPKTYQSEYEQFFDDYEHLMKPGMNQYGGYYSPHTKTFDITLRKESLVVFILSFSKHNTDMYRKHGYIFLRLNFVQMEWLMNNMKIWAKGHSALEQLNLCNELEHNIISYTFDNYDCKAIDKRHYELTADY